MYTHLLTTPDVRAFSSLTGGLSTQQWLSVPLSMPDRIVYGDGSETNSAPEGGTHNHTYTQKGVFIAEVEMPKDMEVPREQYVQRLMVRLGTQRLLRLGLFSYPLCQILTLVAFVLYCPVPP